MSFFEDNKYYIQQVLFKEMAGLSDEDKLLKYDLIRHETRERIFKSYPRNKKHFNDGATNQLNIFYKELFEILGKLELEYIIANLFFETNFTNIVYFIKNNSSIFNELINSPIKQNTFKWLLFHYFEQNDFFQTPFLEFLKEIICNHTTLLKHHLIVQPKKSSNDVFEFVHQYPIWLIDELTKSSQINNTIFIHLIVVKYLNLKPFFTEHSRGPAYSILFIHELSKNYNLKIKLGESPKLHLFYTKTSDLIETLFNKNFIIKTPMLDSKKQHNYPNGFYIKRNEFLKQVEEAEVLNNDFKNKSYSYLFQMIFQSRSQVQEKIKSDIINKIKLCEEPIEDDLKKIIELDESNELTSIKKWILRKFYLFEGLN